MTYSWSIDPATRDYRSAQGEPVPDTSLNVPIYVRLRTPRGGWMYAPDAKYGSTLDRVAKQNNQTPTLIANVMRDALKPLLESKRATTIVVSNVSSRRFREETRIDYITRAGEASTFTIDPLEE
jgi:phage gp46-like protein